jgi:hypothetical protein
MKPALAFLAAFAASAAAPAADRWMPPCLRSTCSLAHPVARTAFGPFESGRVIATQEVPPARFTLYYQPAGRAFLVRRPPADDPVDYTIRSVFAYRAPGSAGHNLVVLYEAGRAIPGMHDAHAYGGYVFGFDDHPFEIPRLSAKLDGVRTAAAARAALVRQR